MVKQKSSKIKQKSVLSGWRSSVSRKTRTNRKTPGEPKNPTEPENPGELETQD